MTLNSSKKHKYSEWYNEIIQKSNIAEYSDIKGCMIIKPYGLSIWENIKKILNNILEKTGHKNCYFPLLIPKTYLKQEEEHIKGFAKECAIITHNKLINNNGNIEIDKNSKLKEELIVRPTSETIIWKTFNKWITSYRDLPLLINQWSNVIRCEMKTKLFLRTTEFLWQEGHTAHANKKEALSETKKIINIYKKFLEIFLAIPVIKGRKTEKEKFSGAEKTYCLEAIMTDGKALQIATSHFLGQKFAKAFNVKFNNQNNKLKYVWGTSWGISTRIIGALIMIHSDSKGLIMPPKIAPTQVVIIPIYKTINELNNINKYVKNITKKLKCKNIRYIYDNTIFYTPGWKFNKYELQGIPIRINIGKKEMKNNSIELIRRDKNRYIKNISLKIFIKNINDIIHDIHKNLFKKAKMNNNKFINFAENYKEFKNILKTKGGFILANWDGSIETEKKIQKETQATVRCVVNSKKKYKRKTCIFSGKISKKISFFAKSY